MKPAINRFFSDAIKGFNHYKIHHFIFWFIYIGFWSFLIGSDVSWRQALVSAWVFIFFHILVSYFNNYFLIEWFLFRRKYVAYFLSVFLSILLVCFPLAIASYLYVPLSEESIANIWTLQFFDGVGLFEF
jgi:hypothetical protein